MKNIIESLKDFLAAIKFLFIIIFLVVAYPFYRKPAKEFFSDMLKKDD